MERWFIFLFLLGLTACSAPQQEPSAQTIIDINRQEAMDLVNTDWNLIEWNGELPDAIMGDITLSVKEEKITGYSGCNHYTADYHFYDTTLSLIEDAGMFTSTLQGCHTIEVDPETGEETRWNFNQEVESKFYDQLRNRHQVTLNDLVNPPRLTLTSDAGVLVFEQAQPPSLTEADWFLEEMRSQNKSIYPYLVGKRSPFIRFLPDGSLEGEFSCHSIMGSYEQNNRTLMLQGTLVAEGQLCAQALKDRDNLFISSFILVETFEINQDDDGTYQLLLLDEEGNHLFQFYGREKR